MWRQTSLQRQSRLFLRLNDIISWRTVEATIVRITRMMRFPSRLESNEDRKGRSVLFFFSPSFGIRDYPNEFRSSQLFSSATVPSDYLGRRERETFLGEEAIEGGRNEEEKVRDGRGGESNAGLEGEAEIESRARCISSH